MVDQTEISSVVGVFPTEAAVQDATGRLTLAGFDRAALSRPSSHEAGVTTETDSQQARTLGSSMAGAVAGMAAAGATIATGGAAGVALLAAAGMGGVAAGAASMIGRGQQETVKEERQAAAPDGQLALSVRVLSAVQQAKAEAAMHAAGASQVLARPAESSVTTEGAAI